MKESIIIQDVETDLLELQRLNLWAMILDKHVWAFLDDHKSGDTFKRTLQGIASMLDAWSDSRL